MNGKKMWEEYKKINLKADKYEAWAFGGTTPESTDILAQLVLNGIKTATASAYPCYVVENEPLPPIGEYNIILNSNEEAVCITRTTSVYKCPFKNVTSEHAYKEGEGDKSLEYWRKVHTEFFIGELKEIGQKFTEDMIVVCEEFEVVYPK